MKKTNPIVMRILVSAFFASVFPDNLLAFNILAPEDFSGSVVTAEIKTSKKPIRLEPSGVELRKQGPNSFFAWAGFGSDQTEEAEKDFDLSTLKEAIFVVSIKKGDEEYTIKEEISNLPLKNTATISQLLGSFSGYGLILDIESDGGKLKWSFKAD